MYRFVDSDAARPVLDECQRREHDPAMPTPQTFTLDTNCLIDVDEERAAAVHIRALLEAHQQGSADLAMVASSASERQRRDVFLSSLDVFNERRTALGFGDLPLLPSIARWDVSFFNNSLWGSAEGTEREHQLYSALFPNLPPEWAAHAAARGASVDDTQGLAYLRWRNQMLDAQALWAHDFAGRSVFVTSDAQLKRLDGHPLFPSMIVKPPLEAAAELPRIG